MYSTPILICFNVRLIGSPLAISLSQNRTEEGAVENIIGLLGVGSAIGLSIMLALGLEWLSLRALMCLMPGAAMQPVRPSAKAEAAMRPEQVSRWASLGYGRDICRQRAVLGAEKRTPVRHERRSEAVRDLLTASGRVRLSRVVWP